MKWLLSLPISLLHCVALLGEPSKLGFELPKYPVRRVSNENVQSFGSMDRVLAALNISDCPNGQTTSWKSVLREQTIAPCLPNRWAIKPPPRTEMADSGILSESGGSGSRSFHSTTLKDCDAKPFKLSFTYDRVPTTCGFEVFIKSPEGITIGLALDKDGNILPEVPEALAFDKMKLKEDPRSSKKITSGKGCFECHPRASSDFESPNSEWFWGSDLDPFRKRKINGSRQKIDSLGH